MSRTEQKHAISSIEFLIQMKGFKHGAAGFSMDHVHSDSSDYNQGYADGQKARRKYSDDLCTKLGLVDPPITAK